MGTKATGSRPCSVLQVSSVEVDRDVVTESSRFSHGKSAREKTEGRKRGIQRKMNRYMVVNERRGMCRAHLHSRAYSIEICTRALGDMIYFSKHASAESPNASSIEVLAYPTAGLPAVVEQILILAMHDTLQRPGTA